VIGSALGGAAATAWGITAPFWFGFAGSAIILAFIWRSLLQIAHADEQHRAETPVGQTPPARPVGRPDRPHRPGASAGQAGVSP
jgi:hypothetical protein